MTAITVAELKEELAGLLGLHFVTTRRIAPQPKAAFVARLRPASYRACRLPGSGPIDNYPGETLPH